MVFTRQLSVEWNLIILRRRGWCVGPTPQGSEPAVQQRPARLTVVSVAPMIAATIYAVFADQSVSEIFQGENLESLPRASRRV
jgi:hypothetical protein